jgi:hypothetical protein
MFQASDKRRWQIKCRSCEKYTELASTFPDCIKLINGVWTRTCTHCGKEIYVVDGTWEPDSPKAREAGFHVTGLLSPFCDLEDAMYRFENNTKNAEFQRSILGIATTDADAQLTPQAVRECVGHDKMRLYSDVRTQMGVDIGEKLHATIGIRTGDNQYEVLACRECLDYQELHAFAKSMNVGFTVIDSGPYDHGAREYQKAHGAVFLCQYSESQPGDPVWTNDRMVKVNRNEWCDRVYQTIMDKRLLLPASCPTMKIWYDQLTRTEKTEIVNSVGLKKPRWVKRGRDDAFHSILYFILASQRCGVRKYDSDTSARNPQKQVSKWK